MSKKSAAHLRREAVRARSKKTDPKKPNGGKIIAALEEAVAGNISRVTIGGQVWTRETLSPEDVDKVGALVREHLGKAQLKVEGKPVGYDDSRAVVAAPPLMESLRHELQNASEYLGELENTLVRSGGSYFAYTDSDPKPVPVSGDLDSCVQMARGIAERMKQAGRRLAELT